MSKLEYLLIILPLLCLQHHLVVASKLSVPNSSLLLALCHEDDAAALLEFKNSLVVNQDCIDYSYFQYIDRNLELWKLEGNCCTWGGIECDVQNGYVIGIDLSQSCLSGSINSSSSLFRLLQLQKLNLAYNDFGAFEIPTAVGNFSRLTSLNLSGCSFAGPIPSQLLRGLTNLTSLDLSSNYELKLDLEILGRSLSKLEGLYLSDINISSSVPNVFANLSSLKFLTMTYCDLQGEFPSTIFNLPKLQVLDLSANINLSIHLPEFLTTSPLQHLVLRGTNISGQLPKSIGNLGSLTELSLYSSKLEGFIPSSIGKLTNLTSLDLSVTELQGPLPYSFGNLTQLSFLDMSFNQISGQVPSSFSNLINLEHLDLHSNQLNGEIPPSLGDLINLEYLDMESNQLDGQIPLQALSNLTRLTFLDLSYNNLQGVVHLDMFLGLKDLQTLIVSFNNLSVIEKSNVGSIRHISSGLLKDLGLGSCKLHKFPNMILHNLETLTFLDLSSNDIHGLIPEWLLDAPIMPLNYLNLSRNFLTSFPQSLAHSKWPNLSFIDLSFNELQGSLPLPSSTIMVYYVSNNNLSGDISSLICNSSNIILLDLPNNNLSGAIPECISNSTEYLQILNLHDNNFYGRIPGILEGRCELLSLMDLSNNQLDGPVPRSLSSCTNLEFINLGNNMLSDTFPSWLGSLDALRVLILRSNKFYGAIEEPNAGFEFPKLQIIDLSQNYFNGPLPSKYFEYWNSTLSHDGYMVSISATGYSYTYQNYIYYTVTLTNKGTKTEYLKILDYFKAIDLSSNSFSGTIPTSVADVQGLHLLNLSNNHLIGHIPPALGDLTDLEALDLSKNFLSGDIPQELMEKLNFLEFFNVSWNNLSGSIPRGKQFSTFGNDSYEGNEGLCGDPLSRKCGNNLQPPPSGDDEEDSEKPFYIEWKAVVVGFISAFIIAALIGHCTITVRKSWFLIIFRLREQR